MARPRIHSQETEGCVAIAELASALDIHEDSIRRHIRRGAPYRKVGNKLWFDVAEYQAWMRNNKLTGAPHVTANAEPLTPDLQAAKLRKETALASLWELRVQKERRDLLNAADVKRWVFEHFGTVRARLLGLGDEMAPAFDGRDSTERAEILNGRIREILNDLATEIERLGGDGDSSATEAVAG